MGRPNPQETKSLVNDAVEKIRLMVWVILMKDSKHRKCSTHQRNEMRRKFKTGKRAREKCGKSILYNSP